MPRFYPDQVVLGAAICRHSTPKRCTTVAPGKWLCKERLISDEVFVTTEPSGSWLPFLTHSLAACCYAAFV